MFWITKCEKIEKNGLPRAIGLQRVTDYKVIQYTNQFAMLLGVQIPTKAKYYSQRHQKFEDSNGKQHF